MLRKLLAVLLVALVAAQFVPVDRSNPPVSSTIEAPEPVRAIFERACWDCHSHETKWPWYSKVAPVSWLVSRDVEEARRHLNFSTWNHYSEAQAAHKIEEIWEEVEKGEMPLKIYLPLHPDAKLSNADREILKQWALANQEGAAH